MKNYWYRKKIFKRVRYEKIKPIISHDLRNPSFNESNGGFALPKLRKMDKAQAGEFLRMLSETAKNNHHLIEKLLYWSVSQHQYIFQRIPRVLMFVKSSKMLWYKLDPMLNWKKNFVKIVTVCSRW